MSDKKMIIKETVHFDATPEQVWDLITNPAKTKQYMFGCELLSDWEVGSDVLWKGQNEEGETMTFVSGKVEEYDEGKKIAMTTFDPNSGMEDVPRNHIPFSYEIEPAEEGTNLTIIQGDFTGADDAKKRYEDSKAGWAMMVIPAMREVI